jgi:hypothetical protein
MALPLISIVTKIVPIPGNLPLEGEKLSRKSYDTCLFKMLQKSN